MSKQLTKAQIAKHLRNAGFSEDQIPTMVGIAGAESTNNPFAHNPNAGTGDNSYGLFQINMLGDMGPERRAQFGIKSNEALFDPATNARAAKTIYDQQGLGAWSVYRSGAYKDHLPTSGDLQAETMSAVSQAPEKPPEKPANTSGGNNVLNVYFGQGSQHSDKKDKAKSLLEQAKESMMAGMIQQIMNQLGMMGNMMTPGMNYGAFDPLTFLQDD